MQITQTQITTHFIHISIFGLQLMRFLYAWDKQAVSWCNVFLFVWDKRQELTRFLHILRNIIPTFTDFSLASCGFPLSKTIFADAVFEFYYYELSTKFTTDILEWWQFSIQNCNEAQNCCTFCFLTFRWIPRFLWPKLLNTYIPWLFPLCAPWLKLKPLMVKWSERVSQWHEMNCHDLEVMSLNPSRVEFGVCSASKSYLIQNI